MRPSELFNDKDKTEELLCGQNTSSSETTGKEKAKNVQVSEGQSCYPH